jgi:hypothetical protein
MAADKENANAKTKAAKAVRIAGFFFMTTSSNLPREYS